MSQRRLRNRFVESLARISVFLLGLTLMKVRQCFYLDPIQTS